MFSSFPLVAYPKGYFILLILVPILVCLSSQDYVSLFPAQLTAAHPVPHVQILITQATWQAVAEESIFFSIVQNGMNIRRSYKASENAYPALHTSNWFQLLWKTPKAMLGKAFYFRPVQQVTSVVHLVRIHSCSGDTGTPHPLHTTPYSDRIPTSSTGYSWDCKLPEHSIELTGTCLDLRGTSAFLSANCRSHKLCFTDSLCIYFAALEGMRWTLVVCVTLCVTAEWLDRLSWWSSTALHHQSTIHPHGVGLWQN